MAVQFAEAELKGVIAAASSAMTARPPASPGDLQRESAQHGAALPAASELAWRPVLQRLPGDLEYVRPDDEVDEDIKCPVCLAWPVDLVLLGCGAGHMLCRGCSSGLRRCPLDRQPLARCAYGVAPARVAERLARLQVRCWYAGGGCAWVGQRGSLLEHCRAECALAHHECRACGAHVRRCELAAHAHAFEAGSRVLWTACGDSPAPVGEVVRADAVSDTAVVRFAGGARPCRRRDLAPARGGAAEAPSGAAARGGAAGARAEAERRGARIDAVLDVHERAERLNACFLVDCTGSMRRHIAAVKNQILRIVREMSVRLPSMQLHVAFVGYRDHGDADRLDVLPFTTAVVDFRAFLGGVGAHGCGGDVPEDVLGGLEAASRLEWGIGGAATRVLIHIGDAPCHGHRYQDREAFTYKDNFPDGDPAGLRPQQLLRALQEKTVQYVFGRINGSTDLMVRLFNEEVGEEYIQTREMRDTRLVAEAVTASLHASVASTVSALSTSLRAARRVEVCDEVPCWQELGVRGVQLHRCLQVSSVADLHRSAPASLTRRFEVGAADIKVGVRPFSQGETRAAHHALMDGREAYVAKFIKEEAGAPDGEEGEWLLEEMLALSEASAVAAFLAREFSAQNPAGPRVEFLEAPVAVPAAGRPFNLERAVPAAEFRRFSNNLGWWEPDADEVLMRFAQFTHEATGGYMMVTDLQGVRTAEGGFLLTDPCVLCHDVMRFGGGNMGQRAMERCTASLAALLDAPQEPDIIVDEPAPEPRAHRPAQEQPSGACFPILPIGAAEHEPERLRWSPGPPAPEAAAPERRGAGLLFGAARAAVGAAGAPAVGAAVASALGAAGLRRAPAAPGAAALHVGEVIAGLMVPPQLAGAAKLPTEIELRALLAEARGVLLSQPVLLELEAPLSVLGDIHGQFKDLLAWLELSGGQQANYLCLGDYVDRGRQSLEVIVLLLALKVKRPENVFLLRGNHECASITRIYGFYDECKRRFNIKLWKTFMDVFNCLPVAAVIEDKVFCCHGGPSPELSDLSLVRGIPRPTDVPDSGILCDLLWADPAKDASGWQENDRGVSFTFGEDVAASFLLQHGLDLIVRAHQVVEDGYEFFAGRRLVTVFSAPNYCEQFDNAGALLEVRSDLQCGFRLLPGRATAWR